MKIIKKTNIFLMRVHHKSLKSTTHLCVSSVNTHLLIFQSCDLSDDVTGQVCDEVYVGGSRVRLMANQLQAKLDESSSTCRSSSSSSAASLRRQVRPGWCLVSNTDHVNVWWYVTMCCYRLLCDLICYYLLLYDILWSMYQRSGFISGQIHIRSDQWLIRIIN